MSDVLTKLAKVLEQRKSADTGDSYVSGLYAKGLNKILEKWVKKPLRPSWRQGLSWAGGDGASAYP